MKTIITILACFASFAASAQMSANAIVYANGRVLGDEWNPVTPGSNTWNPITVGSETWTTNGVGPNTWSNVPVSSNTWTTKSAGNNTWLA